MASGTGRTYPVRLPGELSKSAGLSLPLGPASQDAKLWAVLKVLAFLRLLYPFFLELAIMTAIY